MTDKKKPRRSRFTKAAVAIVAGAGLVAGAYSLRKHDPTELDREASNRQFEAINERLGAAPPAKAAEIILSEIRFHIADNVRRELKGELSDLPVASDSMCFPKTRAMSAARSDAIVRVMATLPAGTKAEILNELKREKDEVERQQDWLGRPNSPSKKLPPRLIREQQLLPPQKWEKYRRRQLAEIEGLRLRRYDLHEFIDVLEEQLSQSQAPRGPHRPCND